MNLLGRIVFLFVIILLLLALFTDSAGAAMVGFNEDDDIPEDDDDFSLLNPVPVAWYRIPVHQLLILLRLEISIFALFVIYLGGRSKHRRFNDRTIDDDMFVRNVCFSLKTAVLQAVFNFLNPLRCQTKNRPAPVILRSSNSCVRRY